MAHKHLNEIGVSSDDPCVFNTEAPAGKKRHRKRFAKQRRQHGFDERETWSMDRTLATWLYEHLKVYEEVADVDLAYHKVTVEKLVRTKKGKLKREAATVTLEEAIGLVLEYLEFYFKWSYDVDRESEAGERLRAALRIVAEIAPWLWW